MKLDIQNFSKAVCHDKRTLEMFRCLVNNAYIRVVNYHNTGSLDKQQFEKEIAYFSRHFEPVLPEDLNRFFQTKKWPGKKPGLIIALYDGLRSQYDTLTPLLEKYGFIGWYFIPAFFPDVSVKEQRKYAQQHDLIVKGKNIYPDGRVALSWDEIREISKKHVICCHTGSHYHITRETSDEVMLREIVESGRRLKEQIQKPVEVFSWQGGEEYLYNLKAHKFLEMAEYKYIVSDLKLEKIR